MKNICTHSIQMQFDFFPCISHLHLIESVDTEPIDNRKSVIFWKPIVSDANVHKNSKV
jgi:hypothetical protein